MQMPLTSVMPLPVVRTAGQPRSRSHTGTYHQRSAAYEHTAFNSKERKFKSIILITDGEDHDPNAVQADHAVVTEGVMINTIGIGSPAGAPIVDPVTRNKKR